MTREQVRSVAESDAKWQLSNSPVTAPVYLQDFIIQLYRYHMVGEYTEAHTSAISAHQHQQRINASEGEE